MSLASRTWMVGGEADLLIRITYGGHARLPRVLGTRLKLEAARMGVPRIQGSALFVNI